MKAMNKIIATGMSVSLALTMTPVVAMADTQTEQQTDAVEETADKTTEQVVEEQTEAANEAADALVADGVLPEGGYDKAEFYSDESTDTDESSVELLATPTVRPVQMSSDMLYFGAYEGGTYDRTFSYGDGYHAMGFYQFDHRYGLQNFIIACYNYDPETYAMFEQFIDVPAAEFRANDAIRELNEETEDIPDDYKFTELGQALIDAWTAAYDADPYEFSRLQDGWAYDNYYMPAENYLASIGIDISDRNDAVKGLCWGLSNLCGSNGWRKFVGGVSDGYDWDGVYHWLSEGYVWPGAGLTNDMTDTEFVITLCDYVIANFPVFYKGQPQYHQGWVNRYKREKVQCLSIIQRTGDTHDIIAGSWYVPYVDEAKRLGIVKCFPEGDFRPEKAVTRAQVAVMLCRAEGAESSTYPGNNTPWTDVEGYQWYTCAMNWAYENGIFEGDGGATSVRPNDTITREEMAKVVATYMEKFCGADIDATGLTWPNGTSNTLQIDELSDWAVPYFLWLANEGIMGGNVNPDGTVSLDPQGTATRAMFAKVVVEAVRW